jgi:hypothetical protein
MSEQPTATTCRPFRTLKYSLWQDAFVDHAIDVAYRHLRDNGGFRRGQELRDSGHSHLPIYVFRRSGIYTRESSNSSALAPASVNRTAAAFKAALNPAADNDERIASRQAGTWD